MDKKVDDSLIDEFLEESFSDGFDMSEIDCPEIEIETDDLKLVITLKKDYSKNSDIKLRKEEFIKDLNDFINEFTSKEELDELMEYYDILNL